MFFYIIAIVHILLCLSLMGLVLLQQGKGADAGAVMGGGADSIMGAGAAGTMVSKATTALAIGFMITSIVLVKFYDQAVVAREAGTNVLEGSVMQGVVVPELPAADEAQAPAAEQAASDADADTAVEAEAGSGVTIVAEETEAAAAPVANEKTADETEQAEAAEEAPAAAESSAENAAAEAGSEEKDMVEK